MTLKKTLKTTPRCISLQHDFAEHLKCVEDQVSETALFRGLEIFKP